METIDDGEFSVTIRSNHVRKVHKNGHEYIALKHNSEYSLELSNHSYNRCDASVMIDGRSVGKFRIQPHNTIHIERPSSHKKKFVFLQENSGDAYRAGITEGRYANGAVSVTFFPEKTIYRSYDLTNEVSDSLSFGTGTRQSYSLGSKNASSFNYMSVNSLSAGATALGDRSTQSFTSVSPLTEIDYDRRKTITFRMVVDDLEWGMIRVRREEWPTIDEWPSVTRHHIDTHPWHDFYPGARFYPEDHHVCSQYCNCYPKQHHTCRHHCNCYDRSRTPPRIDRHTDYL